MNQTSLNGPSLLSTGLAFGGYSTSSNGPSIVEWERPNINNSDEGYTTISMFGRQTRRK